MAKQKIDLKNTVNAVGILNIKEMAIYVGGTPYSIVDKLLAQFDGQDIKISVAQVEVIAEE